MKNLEFKSAICTSVEESKRLLELGLKKETADMSYIPIVINHKVEYRLDCSTPKSIDIPAWSLHRLLCLYGLDYTIKEVYNNAEECYGMLIYAIEIAIEDGHFNEKYLEKQWE